jgi:hypothetical protein
MLEDESVRMAGKAGVMTEMPSLIRLNRPFSYDGVIFTAIGHARFEYEHGYWDEWWAENRDGVGAWISVDEGDIAIEEPLIIEAGSVPGFDALEVGSMHEIWGRTFIVSERGRATCEAIRGALPEALAVGDAFAYVHLRGPGVELVTLEFDDDGEVSASDGHWIDPFRIGTEGEAA